jgi:cytidyltransferase-like protein
MEERVGVIIARLQPIHNGHLELIRQALNENDSVLLLVGSADKLNKRNPIPINMRLEMATEAIHEAFGDDEANRVIVSPLDDLTDETDNSHDWGFYLYSKIVGITRSPEFTIYYSDGFEIIMLWFPPFITRNFVSFKLNARGTVAENISATKVRCMIMNNDEEALKRCIPTGVMKRKDILRQFIAAYGT